MSMGAVQTPEVWGTDVENSCWNVLNQRIHLTMALGTTCISNRWSRVVCKKFRQWAYRTTSHDRSLFSGFCSAAVNSLGFPHCDLYSRYHRQKPQQWSRGKRVWFMRHGPPGNFNMDNWEYLRHFSYAMDWLRWPFLLASSLTQPQSAWHLRLETHKTSRLQDRSIMIRWSYAKYSYNRRLQARATKNRRSRWPSLEQLF
jgi:hypothetical protein